MITIAKRLLTLGLIVTTVSFFGGLQGSSTIQPVKRMLTRTLPISYPTGGNQTDIYVDNRAKYDILVEIPGYDFQIVTTGENWRNHKKIFAIKPQNVFIGRDIKPHFSFKLIINGVDVTIDCWSSSLNGALGAGVRANNVVYTERSATVAGISSEHLKVDVYGKLYDIELQVYPFEGRADINIIVSEA